MARVIIDLSHPPGYGLLPPLDWGRGCRSWWY